MTETTAPDDLPASQPATLAETITATLHHFQGVSIAPERAAELATELSTVNDPVRSWYEQDGDFDQQPVDFLRTLMETRRSGPEASE